MTEGLGDPPQQPILTLPPIEETPGPKLSPSTGQPRRHPVMVTGLVFLYAAALSAAVSFGYAWWQMLHMHTFATSTRLVALLEPRPGSWQSIVIVLVVALISGFMTAAPAITGFQAWNGHRWSRIAGLVSIGIAGLAFFLNSLAWVCLPLTVIGTLIMWSPPVGRYFAQWQDFRDPGTPQPAPWRPVSYGRSPRFQ